MEDALNLQDTAIETTNEGKPCDLDYADDLVYLFQSAEYAQRASDKLAETVAPFGMFFAFFEIQSAVTKLDVGCSKFCTQ